MRSSRWARSPGLLWAAWVLVVLAGCSGSDEPRLEEWTGDAYQEIEFTSYAIDGKRDGAATTATATFTLADGATLKLEFEITYDPTPALGESRWSLDGSRRGSGVLVSESLRFLGGQGEGPSLGGRFRLEQDGRKRYRAVLPVRPVEKPNWSTD